MLADQAPGTGNGFLTGNFSKAIGPIVHPARLFTAIPVRPDGLRLWPQHQIFTALCLGALPLTGGAAEPTPSTASTAQAGEETLQLRLRLDTAIGHMQTWASKDSSPLQRSPGTGTDIETAPQAPAKESIGAAVAPRLKPQAQVSNSTQKPAQGAETLLLEVFVNGQPLPGIIRVERLADARIVLPLEEWALTRLITPAAAPIALPDDQRGYALQDAPGLRYALDGSLQTLQITVPASAFQATSLVLGAGQGPPPKPALPGVYFNYDGVVTHAQGRPDTGGVLVEGIAFSGPDSLVSGAVLTHDGVARRTVRTETFWRRDLPGSMEALVLGDTIGSGGAWSRPVRYGGLRFARDFSLAPGYISYPMPTLQGSAALPSTVDVIVNNQRRSSNLTVGPGPFDLTNVPVVSGSGEVNLVVRDLRGVETVITQKYYLSPRLLAPGLSDFSLDAGRLRRNYGLYDSGYGPGFAAATYRYGLNNALTGEGRVEVQKTRKAAGFEVSGLVGTLGVAQATAAWSRSDPDGRDSPRSGGRYLLAFERSAPLAGGGSLQLEHFDAGFRQFGDLGSEVRPRDRLQAQTGMSLERLSLGVSYTRQTTWEGDNFRLLALSIGTPIFDRLFLSLYATKRLGPEGSWSAGMSLVMPLEQQRSVIATSTRDNDGRFTTAVQASQSPPVGPGWGWQVRASDQARQRAQADAILNTDFGQLRAEANAGNSNHTVRLGASGSVGWLAGLPFATRRIDHGAFAVVRVADLPDVPVYRSNQIAATTNSQGLALVTGLRPYQQNQLSLDPDQLPFNLQINGVEEMVTPYARSGIFVDFPVRRMRNAQLVLQQPDSTPVPAGALVTLLPGRQTFVVGQRGEAYLTDLKDSNRLLATWENGTCELTVALGPAGDGEPRIGPLICIPRK